MGKVTHSTCCCGTQHTSNETCHASHQHTVSTTSTTETSCCGSEHHHEHDQGESCTQHTHDNGDDDPDGAHKHHHHEHAHSHSRCCSSTPAILTPFDSAEFGESSDTKAIYRIVNMDCPMEEALICKKLTGMDGIQNLEFNLMQRVLTVHHQLPSTEPIEQALKSIDMTPEPIKQHTGDLATFSMTEMDCPIEENLIRAKLANVQGVIELDVNLVQRILKVRYQVGALPTISTALNSLNLGATLLDAEQSANLAEPVSDIPWKRLIVAGVFAFASEATELIHEWQWQPLGINFDSWTIGNFTIFEWLPLLLAVIAILVGGLTTYRKGWIAVKNFNLNINALMSVAVTGAVFIGQYPEAAMVMVLFNIAEAIEAKSLDRARNAIKNLLALAPEKATVRQADDSWVEQDIRQIAIGSKIRVRPGEKVGLDGLITLGQPTLDQSAITGESLPVEKQVGDQVFAGTINASGSFEFEVIAAATDSTLSRIIHAVEEAQGSRAPIQRFVDQFARIYTPAVFLVALLVAILMPTLMSTSWYEGIYTALVMLVIGCPCALVISTPVTIVSGMAAATRHGILVKGGMFLEQGRLLKWMALDKTGTITYGKPKQTDFVQYETLDPAQATQFAASIAVRSDHPVSKAIADAAKEQNIPFIEIAEFTALAGQGVSALIEGQTWYLGNYRLVKAVSKASSEPESIMTALEQQGKSVVAVMNQTSVQGIFAVADTVKESSIDAIKALKQLGVKTIMLTGDNAYTAKVIAQQVGVDEFKGDLLPEDKLTVVRQLSESGKIGMVGDGINDAPALAKADIGFAMAAAGTDTAIETADVALMDDDLRKLPRFIRLSKATYAILVQNIVLALGVKAIFFTLTFTGHATMWMAVFADVGTSLLVVMNGLRAMRK